MSCCGKKREAWRGESPMPARAPSRSTGVAYFRYLGNKAITVQGPATGRIYRFWGSGATAAADPKDAPGMAAVPQLVHVNNP